MKTTRLFVSLLVVGATLLTTSAPAVAADAPRLVPSNARDYVFVINRLGARPIALAGVRAALAGFTREALQPGDRVMIVDVGYSTRVVQELTDSRVATLRAIDELSLLPIRVDRRVATRQLYRSLQSLAGELDGLPGRKAVVLASTEPNVIREGVHYMTDTVAALNVANASVFSLDLDVFRRPFARLGAGTGLSGLAADTGGRYFFNRSKISFLPALLEIPALLDVERSAGAAAF